MCEAQRINLSLHVLQKATLCLFGIARNFILIQENKCMYHKEATLCLFGIARNFILIQENKCMYHKEATLCLFGIGSTLTETTNRPLFIVSR